MNQKKTITSIVIGSDNLTIQCMSILLAKKHILLGVISSAENVKQWCITNSISHFETFNDLKKHNSHLNVDILFSIVNEQILPASVLEYPRIGAINYHNSQLPKYAGLYVTSWAILNGETEHAITWHWMKAQVDAGDILKQLRFSIDSKETALTLNLKCYEHAVQAFSELLDELSTNSEASLQQDLTLRTYYGVSNKPKNLGFIDYGNSADEIERLCRALFFGNYRNELATPKIVIENKVFIVRSCEKLTEKSYADPGTIVSLKDEAIRISTNTTDVLLFDLIDLKGNIFRSMDVNVAIGQKLVMPLQKSHESLDNIEVCYYSKYEFFWVNEYKKCINNEISFLSKLNLSDTQSEMPQVITEIELSHKEIKILNDFSEKAVGVKKKHILLVILLIYWYRLNNYKNFSVSYSSPELQKLSNKNFFLSHNIPITTHFAETMTLREALSWSIGELGRLGCKNTHMRDIFIRYPEIRSVVNMFDLTIGFYKSHDKKNQCEQSKISVNIAEDGTSLQFCYCVNYKSQELSFAFLKNFRQHLLNLLTDAVNKPEVPLFELSFLDEEEKNCLLHRWNKTYFHYDKNKLLHHYFENQARTTPHAIAIAFNAQSVSYEEINHQANMIAAYLRAQHIKSNDIIGVYLRRGLDMMICILGILKTGAAYLSLDPHYPDKRIKYMLHHSQSKIVLTNNSVTRTNLVSYQGKVIDVSVILNNHNFSCENFYQKASSSDLAYIIYTSGTTGTPKGVAITHLSACNHMVWMKNHYDFSEQDVFLLKTPFSFDASVWEIFIPFFVGAKLVIAPDDAHTNPDTLIKLIQHKQVSIIQLVPSMLRELILTAKFNECSSLRHVFCGGEVLLQEIIHSFMENNCFGALLHNLYGPTEATIDAITLTCCADDVVSIVSRIGKPIYNTKLLVLDKHMQLMPIGIIGELYIAGDCLAKGYLHNPNMTAQKFLSNPFDFEKKNKIYKTGDLVKWQNDGIIEYHGRIDSQVKIRGFRIEVSEIESCLETHPAICQCLVKPEIINDSAMVLSAYISAHGNEKLTAADIRDKLKQNMPDYMIPTRYFIVDKFITTPSGKLDRNAKLSTTKQLYFAKEHVSPQTQIEYVLHQIWCDVLRRNDLGIYDDFFELGGHSLLAMQIITRVKQELLAKITIRALFDYPTIHSLSKEIERLDLEHILFYDNFTNILIPIKKTGHKNPLFLVHPVGGSVFWYTAIGQYLDPEIPLYGLQDPGIEAKDFIFESIENMANTYINAIRAVQPNGPYLIGGASFGSTVAVEMARQLCEKGEKIEAIISLDGWAVYPSLQSDEVFFKEKMRLQNSKIMNKYIQHNVSDPNFLLELQWHREKLLTNYQLQKINFKFILFKASTLNEMFNYEAPLNWWDDYTNNQIVCHLVPGDHETMFAEPNVAYLTMKLNKCLKTGDQCATK